MRPSQLLATTRLGATAIALAATPLAVHGSPGPGDAPPTAAVAVAHPTGTAPILDGRSDDAIWTDATAITAFRQFSPVEDIDPSLRTEVRVAYDATHLYVFIRAFDPRPDSIVALLARRDTWDASDRLHVFIDSYLDRRTGFEFAVSAAGVKIDATIVNDVQEDLAWDGVWDVATQVDSLGWTAEFRIPFSQLRFARASDPRTFGFGLIRTVGRTGERMSWPLMRRTKPGISSQLGELGGLRGVRATRRLEVMPYTVVRDRSVARGPDEFGRAQDATAGVDLRMGVGGGLTLAATVNPDFGQVEADPSVLNLTAFEQIYEERRPFFVEGGGIFRYDITCGGPACNGLFYSRRIGRSPQLAGLYGGGAEATRILGATKLTGTVANGVSIGLLGAVTAREEGTAGRTSEPRTGYGVLRMQKDWRTGLSNAGLMVTGVQRSLDDWTRDQLRAEAYVLGFDTRHRFWNRNYMARAYAAGSHVTGSAAAITRTMRTSAHYYQRPDDGYALDTTATALDGTVFAASFAKNGGGRLRFSTAYRYTSKGFEPNDAGFLFRSDYQAWQNSLGFQFFKPTRWYRQAGLTALLYGVWNASSQLLGGQGVLMATAELPSQWNVSGSVFVDGIGAAVDDRLLRGGPAVRRDAKVTANVSVDGDRRRAAVPSLGLFWQPRDPVGSWGIDVRPELTLRPVSSLTVRVGAQIGRGEEAAQFAGSFADSAGIRHHTVTHLAHSTIALTTRFDMALTPSLTFQLYASPFAATGRQSDWRELADARAADPSSRFRPYLARGPASALDFHAREFRSSAVARWEYRPGSTLYVVWTQGRSDASDPAGAHAGTRDLAGLFRTRPDNTVLVKASYWLGR